MDTRSAPIVSQDASHDNRPAAATAAPNRSGGDRNWSTRIRASIARLMEIDGISLDPERYAKLTEEKRAAKEAERTFLERVDRLQAASEAAHREHCERLRDVYPASTAKKMRLATVDQPSSSGVASIPPSMPPAPCHPRHEALDALAVAAATEEFNESGATIRPTTSKGKRPNRRQTLLHLEDGAGKLFTCVHMIISLMTYTSQVLSRTQCVSTTHNWPKPSTNSLTNWRSYLDSYKQRQMRLLLSPYSPLLRQSHLKRRRCVATRKWHWREW
ncbi:hypothetical protein, variant [Phytophthora nicotianae P10297]|uniref:Uncharacterized protein n=1 Tax=Phytophthora nicotianae P10297 TaxID=1317064 RepID=W2Z6R9_PHYNI|nr:hypothetical protein F442_11113 [Phytophthora nicotianae P10297]ETP41914.1 hypothetical protein, variant [Phytophthora nicotianae P10297]